MNECVYDISKYVIVNYNIDLDLDLNKESNFVI